MAGNDHTPEERFALWQDLPARLIHFEKDGPSEMLLMALLKERFKPQLNYGHDLGGRSLCCSALKNELRHYHLFI